MSLWPGVAIGTFVFALSLGTAPAFALANAAGNVAGPLAAAWALEALGFHHALERPRDLLLYAALGVAGGTLLTATNDAVWVALWGTMEAATLSRAWLFGWLSAAAGNVVLAIPLLTFPRVWTRPAIRAPGSAFTVLISLATVAAAIAAFAPLPGTAQALTVAIFAVPVLVCWLAARRGLFVASLVTTLVAAIAVFATARGHGPFVDSHWGTTLTLLWSYTGALAAIPLAVGSLLNERTTEDKRWSAALDHAGIGIGDWDTRRREIKMSGGWLSILGFQAQSFGTSASAAWKLIHEEDRPSMKLSLVALRTAQRSGFQAEFRMRCSDGSWKWLEGRAVVSERRVDGAPAQLLLTVRDVGEQRAAQERQQLSAKLFQHLREGLLITDANHRVLDLNPTFSAITGYSRDEMLGTVPFMLRSSSAGSAAEHQRLLINDSVKATGLWHGEVVDRRRNGETCTLQVTVSALKSQHGQVRFHAVALTDVTEARRQREQLERQAHCDELTGLPNRTRLAQMLRESMQASERDGFLLTICYLDLDHFKPVNDQFGHEVGDRLLVDLADRLRRSLRQWASGDDAVARLGGDEFVLLLRTATVEEGRHAVERVMRNVSQPYDLEAGDEPLMVTASIGATVYPIDHADADTLLRHADHAMYGAKQAGRNGYLFFDAEHDRRTEAHFEALGRVQDALEAQEFMLYYQPKVNMRLGTVLGMEALLRWQHPQHGVVSPAQFLPLIEHTGLSARLGDWVLQQGIRQLATWNAMGLDMTVSINVSARHLQEPSFGKRLASLLSEHGPEVAHHLVIEVLETAALADVDYTSALMQECQALGVRFALDDFGTGYSTFTYLKRLPLDLLKIDRSFVHNMLDDRQDMAIVEGVIGLSQTFGCTVVAEGVESAEQARRLIGLGCDIGQGNGIAAAMPVDVVPEWVHSYHGDLLPTRAENATQT